MLIYRIFTLLVKKNISLRNNYPKLSMGKKRVRDVSLTQKRDLALYVHYINLLHTKGESARYSDKVDIYSEVAEPFFISPDCAGRIIRKYVVNISNSDIPKAMQELIESELKKVRGILDAIKREDTAGKD